MELVSKLKTNKQKNRVTLHFSPLMTLRNADMAGTEFESDECSEASKETKLASSDCLNYENSAAVKLRKVSGR